MSSIVTYLDNNCGKIETRLRKKMRGFATHDDYAIAWKLFEEKVIAEFASILKPKSPDLQVLNLDSGSVFSEDDLEIGEPDRESENKNRTADLLIKLGQEKLLISVKSCKSGKRPANDLGTLRSYSAKAKNYSAVFEIWIAYRSDKGVQPPTNSVCEIFFDRAFRFVGRRRDGIHLAYREKDGNLRPKGWQMFVENRSHWDSIEHFEGAMRLTIGVRAKAIVRKHLPDLAQRDRLTIAKELLRDLDEDDLR